MRTAIISFATCSPLRYAGVVALGNDIGQPIVDRDLDLDVGICRQEFRKLRQQDGIGSVFGSGHANGAGGLLAKFPYRRKLGLDLRKARSHRAKEALARFGRRDASGCPSEKPHAEPRFEFTQRVAEGRLRNTELRRRVGEAPLLCNGEEGHQVVEIAALHLSRPLISPCRL